MGVWDRHAPLRCAVPCPACAVLGLCRAMLCCAVLSLLRQRELVGGAGPKLLPASLSSPQGAHAVDLVATYRWLLNRDAGQPTFNLPQNGYLQARRCARQPAASPPLAPSLRTCHAGSGRRAQQGRALAHLRPTRGPPG